ncbi:hypothetical protein E2C01_009481 [Portunus trituberculatus]|uniref:Uncharacterized protein n=1 Tax=Portunus trituberculatus TaxID=210409 RepID=A0A5B7D5V8_PORTR|nr:hypothetical protein [Portunus trituberculatus]
MKGGKIGRVNGLTRCYDSILTFEQTGKQEEEKLRLNKKCTTALPLSYPHTPWHYPISPYTHTMVLPYPTSHTMALAQG